MRRRLTSVFPLTAEPAGQQNHHPLATVLAPVGHPRSLGQIHDFGDDRLILCFLVFDTFRLSVGCRILAVQRFPELSSFAFMRGSSPIAVISYSSFGPCRLP